MADGDAGRCEPYRVEWRRFLTSGWMRMDGWMGMGDRATFGEATKRATQILDLHGGQVRVVEQRVVLVRGLGQDGGPDSAFMGFASRNLKAAERQAADTMAQAETLRDAITSDFSASSEGEEPEQAMPDGLFFSERELWKTAILQDIDGHEVRAVLRRLAMLRRDLRSGRSVATIASAEGMSVVSDPDDRRDVEAAADAGQPMAPRWFGSEHNVRDSTVTDMAGCSHRMSSGAVSLTACGECGADPGDDCAEPLGWRVHRPEAIRLGVLHPPAGANRLSWHAWLDELGVPRHAEPEQQTASGPTPLHQRRAHFHMPSAEAPVPFGGEQTATAPASCTERMAEAMTPERGGHLERQCPECNAQPGEPCADPLEDRIAWRVKQTGWDLDGTSTVELYWQRLTEDHGRRTAHENLDLTGVPRHGTRSEETSAEVDALLAELPSLRARRTRREHPDQ